MTKKHKVIIIPGLGDHSTKPLEFATSHFRMHGLNPVVYPTGWRDSETFKLKLQRLVDMIDGYIKSGNIVSLIGTSAGGSAALNVFIERKNTIYKMINVCGRLRVGTETGFRSFKSKTSSSPAFAESVLQCQSTEKSLSDIDRKRIMTVHAQFGDELVPPETTIINGAKNISIPTVEHIVSIGLALTLFSKPIIEFLKR